VNSSSKTITLTLPAGTRTETLKAVLNGHDVSSLFAQTSCEAAVCEEATLTSSDGLLDDKNVLYAVAKKSDGTLASSRLRFVGNEMQATTRAAMKAPAASGGLGGVNSSLPTASNFIPPSVRFTADPGGFGDPSGTPWITVGTQQSYPSVDCFGPYVAVVLDRKTLVQKTASPEVSPRCLTSTSNLKDFLTTDVASTDLVIVGTTQIGTADATLDTSLIGGKVFGCGANPAPANCGKPGYVSSNDIPVSYLAIGVGGATPGSAYESYDTTTSGSNETFLAFATGMLMEDVNGNYNFQSSGPVEYTVSPNDPTNGNQSTVTLQGTSSLARYRGYTIPNKIMFLSPAGQTNGYWLLQLRRNDLDFVVQNPNNSSGSCIAQTDTPNQQTKEIGCGQFFPTGATDAPTAANAYFNLSQALGSASPNDLQFLVSVGTAAYSANQNAFDVAQSATGPFAGIFGAVLEILGGTPGQTLSLYTPGSAYTLITCQDCGGSLNGHAVLSTTVSAQQGQTGFVHGLLGRDLDGLYWSTQASQETQTQDSANLGADFTMSIVGSQVPVEWPELSSTLIAGASTVTGQNAAYHYLSYQLVTQHYIQGAQGNYLDDLHFYFTGSNNTYIDYHTFDPVKDGESNVSFPGTPGTCYSWPDPVTNSTLPCFTQQDLSTVAQQVHTEIVDFDNVLQYMVNGSTNMKDIVAAGNGSAALALVGAASIVQGSSLQPSVGAPVSINPSSIMTFFSAVTNLAVQVASDGLVDPEQDEKDLIGKVGFTAADILDLSSSIAGGYTTGGGDSLTLPSPEYAFTTQIGDLANSGLQQQTTAGFDTILDTFLGDWGKLSAIGPLITDSSNLSFYSPNQAAQNITVKLLGLATERSFFMSLMPTQYSIQYYPSWITDSSVTPANPPNMGNDNGNESCNSWYNWNSGGIPQLVSTYYPSYLGTPDPWPFSNQNSTPIDYYVIGAKTVTNESQSNQFIPVIDSQLATTLFSAAGLNIPIDSFVTPHGPMAAVFYDATKIGFDGYPANQTVACGNERGVGGIASTPSTTLTSLVVPDSTVLGEALTIQAAVTAQAGTPTGTVSFMDGNTNLGTGKLDASGITSISTSALTLGSHSITAYYLVNDPYSASQSASSTVTVYSNAPSMSLSLSAQNTSVSYGTTSTPITLQVDSRSGLAGAVNFSCTGLPVGMSCTFNPAQTNITAGASATTSFTITSKGAQAAGLLWFRGIGALFLPFSLFSLWRLRIGRRRLRGFVCLLLLSAISLGVIGCSGGSKPEQLQETGSKTVLVTATSGSVTRTIPLVVNIQ